MKRLDWLILVFSISFATFFLLPPFLNWQFALYPLMKTADVFDIMAPLALIPLYWVLYKGDGKASPGPVENLLFLVLAAAWVEGHGIHLSSNSIGHWLNSPGAGPAQILASFYDEALSHYLWHAGVTGLSALIVIRQWNHPSTKESSIPWLPGIAGIIYGFTYFAIVIEGGTYLLGLPFALLVPLFILLGRRRNLHQQPVLTFFLVAHVSALAFFALWAAMWGGLPQFSETGIIN